VTGGTSGIGLAVFHRYAREGYDLVFCGRDARKGERVAAEITRKYGSRPIFVPADVCEDEAVRHMIEQGPGRLGRLDVLCNNAGIQKIGAMEDSALRYGMRLCRSTHEVLFSPQKWPCPT